MRIKEWFQNLFKRVEKEAPKEVMVVEIGDFGTKLRDAMMPGMIEFGKTIQQISFKLHPFDPRPFETIAMLLKHLEGDIVDGTAKPGEAMDLSYMLRDEIDRQIGVSPDEKKGMRSVDQAIPRVFRMLLEDETTQIPLDVRQKAVGEAEKELETLYRFLQSKGPE